MRYAATAVAIAVTAAAMPAMAEQTPEQAVTAFCARIAGSNYTAAAKCLHPADLAKMKDTVIPGVIKTIGTNGAPQYLRGFVKDDTPESLSKLSAEDVFIRLMTWYAESLPQGMSMLARTTIAPLGNVKEGENAHVVCRQTRPLLETTVVSLIVITASKDGDSWKIAPPTDYQMIARQISGQRSTFRPGAAPTSGRTHPAITPTSPRIPGTTPPNHMTKPVPPSTDATKPPVAPPPSTLLPQPPSQTPAAK